MTQKVDLERDREILAEGRANVLNLLPGNEETQLRSILFVNCKTIELGTKTEC